MKWSRQGEKGIVGSTNERPPSPRTENPDTFTFHERRRLLAEVGVNLSPVIISPGFYKDSVNLGDSPILSRTGACILRRRRLQS